MNDINVVVTDGDTCEVTIDTLYLEEEKVFSHKYNKPFGIGFVDDYLRETYYLIQT